MELLIKQGMLGTQRSFQDAQPDLSFPPDQLIDQLELEPETAFLLRVGAQAHYFRVGHEPVEITSKNEIAKEETLDPCSRRVAHVLSQMFRGEADRELLPLFLLRMATAKQRIPFSLLPHALNVSTKKYHSIIAPVLGERGRWLADQNPDWSWVFEQTSSAQQVTSSLEELEQIWEDGRAKERLSALEELREIDSGHARQLILASFKKEKADFRKAALEIFSHSPKSSDTELFQHALSDRSQQVKKLAVMGLLRLEDPEVTSLVIGFMQEHVEITDEKEALKLACALPDAFQKDWKRFGIEEKTYLKQMGPKQFWVSQWLSYLPVSRWEEFSKSDPERILEAAQSSDDAVVFMHAIENSLSHFENPQWLKLLFQACWNQRNLKVNKRQPIDYLEMSERLLPLLPSKVLQEIFSECLHSCSNHTEMIMLFSVGKDQEIELSKDDLKCVLQEVLSTFHKNNLQKSSACELLKLLAKAIPTSRVLGLLEWLDVFRLENHMTGTSQQKLDETEDILRFKQLLYEEIPLE